MDINNSLTQCRELFYTGYFSRVVNLSNEGHIPIEEQIEIACLKALALAKLKNEWNLSDAQVLNSSYPGCPAVKAVEALFTYYNAFQENPLGPATKKAAQSLTTFPCEHDVTARIISGSFVTTCREACDAVELTHRGTLELQALATFLYLFINRPDLAENSLKDMMAVNDDAAICKSANGWVSIATGNHQEAYLTFNDVISRCSDHLDAEPPSSIMLNGRAAANLQRQLWQEAEEDLLKALEVDSRDPSVIANLICIYARCGQSDKADSFFQHLKAVDPQHPVVTQNAQVDAAFAKFAESSF